MRPPLLAAIALLSLTGLTWSQEEAQYAGLTCVELSDALQAQVEKVHGSACGVLVKSVAAGSFAERSGVQPGDILISVRLPEETEFMDIPVLIDCMIQFTQETAPATDQRLLVLREKDGSWHRLSGYLGKPLTREGSGEQASEAAPKASCDVGFESETPAAVLARTPDGFELTQKDVDLYGGIMAWSFGTRLTEAQKVTVREALIDCWPKAPPSFRNDFETAFRALPDQLPRMPPQVREQLRVGYASTFLRQAQMWPADSLSRVILEVSAGARQVLAGAGTEAELTVQDVDAMLEYACFQTQVQTGQPVLVTPAQRSVFHQQAVAHYQQASPAERLYMAQMDAMWATLRARWTAAALAQRQALAQQWQQAYQQQAAAGATPAYMNNWQNACGGGGEMSDSTFNAVMNSLNSTHDASMSALGSIDGYRDTSVYDSAGNWLYDY